MPAAANAKPRAYAKAPATTQRVKGTAVDFEGGRVRISRAGRQSEVALPIVDGVQLSESGERLLIFATVPAEGVEPGEAPPGSVERWKWSDKSGDLEGFWEDEREWRELYLKYRPGDPQAKLIEELAEFEKREGVKEGSPDEGEPVPESLRVAMAHLLSARVVLMVDLSE